MMTDSQKLFLLAVAAFSALLLYFLAPVLTPFLIAALLAYLGDPLVDRLEAHKFSRSAAVITVFSALSLVLLLVVIILLPMLQQELVALVKRIPEYFATLQQTLLPWSEERLGVDIKAVDIGQVKAAVTSHWQQVGGAAAGVLGAVTASSMVLLMVLANLVLIPVVAFYLLRDWDILVRCLHELLPRRFEAGIAQLVKDCDEMLGAFMHGQLLVMLALGTFYSIGLWIVGLEMALLIGMVAGLVSFVPYLGFILGVLFAGVVALMQYQDFIHLFYVLLVFGFGQLLESLALTPYLLGDRIGLHPVAVIFAVMAGGQLFGFFGMLLALPAAAVIMVLLRHAHTRYVDSTLYSHQESTGEAAKPKADSDV